MMVSDRAVAFLLTVMAGIGNPITSPSLPAQPFGGSGRLLRYRSGARTVAAGEVHSIEATTASGRTPTTGNFV
ncbi:MAG: hypothetical protein PGN25_13610 [Methylorubrum populi]